jgi:hypothetical protein
MKNWRPADLHLIFIKESSRALCQTDSMQRIAQCLTCLTLALALVLTGPGGAGPAKGAMLIELCAGDRSSQVWIDAEGNPVNPGKMHGTCLYCIDFTAPFPTAADGLLAPGRLPRRSGPSLPVSLPTPPIAYLRSLPRGPPVLARESLRLGDPRPDTRSLPPLVLILLDTHQVEPRTRVTELRATL